MQSLVLLVLPLYFTGFVAMAFWWRWWLLLPASALAIVLAIIEAAGIARADGPGLALGAAIFLFLGIGAGSGFIASLLMIVGCKGKWAHAIIVLPVVFGLGFGSVFAVVWWDKRAHEARMMPPPAECVNKRHLSRLGSAMLSIPIAPNIVLTSPDASEGRYEFSNNANYMVREFCSDAEVSPPDLASVAINLDGTQSRRLDETKHVFCIRKHPDLIWANMTCTLIPDSSIVDMPVKFDASIMRNQKDVMAIWRKEMLISKTTMAADGVRTYAAKHFVYLQRPDGYLAQCHKMGSRQQPYLRCSANLQDGEILLSYDFRSTQSVFLAQSATVENNVRAIFASLKASQ